MKRRTLIALAVLLVFAASGSVASGEGATVCHVPGDYSSIQDAVDDETCATIVVGPGNWAGAIVDRAVEIRGEEGAIITAGPSYRGDQPAHFLRAGFRLDQGADGTGIQGFRFEGEPVDGASPGSSLGEYLAFPVFSRNVNDVTISHNTMHNSLQAISNWSGSGWIIQHNSIEGLWVLCGGGIGILVGTRDGTPVSGNLIAHNTVLANVSPDCAFYTTPGIALISDTRWGAAGGPIEGNRVLHNRSHVTGTWEGAPAGVGMEIADGGLLYDHPWTGDGIADVTGNTVAMNDFRGSSLEINFGPSETEDNNTVTRNLGANRGDGGAPAGVLFR